MAEEAKRVDELSPQEHLARHKELHRMLDEIFADYILHQPKEHKFMDMPLGHLVEWSHSQTIAPDELNKEMPRPNPGPGMPSEHCRAMLPPLEQKMHDWLYEDTRTPELAVLLLGMMNAAASLNPSLRYWDAVDAVKERFLPTPRM